MATPREVADYMLARLQAERYLYQQVISDEITVKFGEEHTYYNRQGNRGIAKPVLKEFEKLTGTDVVWERGQRLWRYREAHDDPNKRRTY